MTSSIPMRAIFEELDFEKFDHPLTSNLAYRTSFGPYVVEAVVLVNRWFEEVFMLSGVVNTGRTIGSIAGELPLAVETKEEGLALLSYFLASQIPEQHKTPWLRIGERMTTRLPWRRPRAPNQATR
jgi:hypothetical protein